MKLILRNLKGQFINMMLTATVRKDDNLRFIRLKEYFSDMPKKPLQLTIWEDELNELHEKLSKKNRAAISREINETVYSPEDICDAGEGCYQCDMKEPYQDYGNLYKCIIFSKVILVKSPLEKQIEKEEAEH